MRWLADNVSKDIMVHITQQPTVRVVISPTR
jgi:hypothetical protein